MHYLLGRVGGILKIYPPSLTTPSHPSPLPWSEGRHTHRSQQQWADRCAGWMRTTSHTDQAPWSLWWQHCHCCKSPAEKSSLSPKCRNREKNGLILWRREGGRGRERKRGGREREGGRVQGGGGEPENKAREIWRERFVMDIILLIKN